MTQYRDRAAGKTDRRIRRTRRLLGEALLALVQEQSFDSVTIRQITDRADIGYATFFRHYDSKEELLSEQLEQIVRQLEALAGEPGDHYFEREGTLFFEHVRANEDLYRALLAGHVDVQVVRHMRDALIRVIQPHMARHEQSTALVVPLEIAANHVAAASLELAAWWLENDRPYSPEQMGRYYRQLIIDSTWHAILPDPAGDGRQ